MFGLITLVRVFTVSELLLGSMGALPGPRWLGLKGGLMYPLESDAGRGLLGELAPVLD